MSENPESRPERSEADRRITEAFPTGKDEFAGKNEFAGKDETARRDDFGQSESSLQWRRLFEDTLPGLRAFLNHRLSQSSDVDDCLQVVSVKMIEKGAEVAPAARRAWLFRVAANESARMWRSKSSTQKVMERYATEDVWHTNPDDELIRSETAERVREAIAKLPSDWQQVVRLRIHENLTFQQISERLEIPLGTALTQMRRALERLKREVENDQT